MCTFCLPLPLQAWLNDDRMPDGLHLSVAGLDIDVMPRPWFVCSCACLVWLIPACASQTLWPGHDCVQRVGCSLYRPGWTLTSCQTACIPAWLAWTSLPAACTPSCSGTSGCRPCMLQVSSQLLFSLAALACNLPALVQNPYTGLAQMAQSKRRSSATP